MAMFGSEWNYSVTGTIDYYWLDNGDQDGRFVPHVETDEETLDKIDIKVIEKYLRKKKLEKLEKK
jgi:hypothetical protein